VATGASPPRATVTQSELTATYQGQFGAVLTNSDDAHLLGLVSNSTFTNIVQAGVLVGQASGNASATSLLEAQILNNTLFQDVSAIGSAITGSFNSTTGAVARARVQISQNYVSTDSKEPGVLITTPDPAATPAIDATISTNHVDMNDLTATLGMVIGATQGGASTDLCANIITNNSHHYPNGPAGGGVLAQQAGGATFRLELGNADVGDPPATVLQRNQLLSQAPLVQTETQVTGTLSVVANGSCLLPTAP
jgi:hypothetical protein